MRHRTTTGVLAVLLFGSVSGPGIVRCSFAEEEAAQGSHGGDAEPRVRLSGERLRVAGIEIAPVQERDLVRKLVAAGEVTLNADHTGHIGARVPGRIARIDGFLGDQVAAGQRLLLLDSVELGHYVAEFEKARARMQLMKRTHEREERLFREQISSERVMLEAQIAYEEARIEFETTEKTLHLITLGVPEDRVERIQMAHVGDDITLLPVVAPFAGVIVEKHVALGEMVDPTKTLYIISDLSTVWVETSIYEKDLRSVRQGGVASLVVPAYPDQVFEGVITYLGDLLDKGTRSVMARVEVANPDRKLRAGMYADVEILTESLTRMPAVPEASLQSDGEGWIVYVTEDGLSFEARKVQTGERQEGYVAVLEGLETGERIVVKGGFFIKSEAAKEGFEAGHGD